MLLSRYSLFKQVWMFPTLVLSQDLGACVMLFTDLTFVPIIGLQWLASSLLRLVLKCGHCEVATHQIRERTFRRLRRVVSGLKISS